MVHFLKHHIEVAMGNLLRLLSREPSQEDHEIFVDFESKLTTEVPYLSIPFPPDAQVTASEEEVFGQVRESMSKFNQLIALLREYRGAEAERRQV